MKPGMPRFWVVAYCLAYPVLLVLAALALPRSCLLAFGILLAPGLHVTMQLALFYHELWHNHHFETPGTNRAFYYLVSLALCLDPQFDSLVHPTHHERLHTYDDLEFWPRGRPPSVAAARRQFVAELLLGKIAWAVAVGPSVRIHPEYRAWREVTFMAVLFGFHVGLALLTHHLGGPWWGLLVAVAVNTWLFAVAVRYLQFAEHLGVLAPDRRLRERIALCRNVRWGGPVAWAWHLGTLGDTADHRGHHRFPGRAVRRPFPMPGDQAYEGIDVPITALPGILVRYWKDPLRELQV